MYRNTHWIDEVKDQETEEVIQEGTPQSAGHFNNMEGGISDAHLAAALLIIQGGLTAAQVEVEEKTVTLSNSQSYPLQQLHPDDRPQYRAELHGLHRGGRDHRPRRQRRRREDLRPYAERLQSGL